MEEYLRGSLEESAALLRRVAADLSPDLARAVRQALTCLRGGGKLAFCGNGGSASQAQHLAGELVGRFRRERPGFAALALSADSVILTALGNDYGFSEVFRRQVEALLRPGDMLIALSTSGEAENVLLAVEEARTRGVFTLAFTGESGGRLAPAVDLCLRVPHTRTALVQEAHLALGHLLCDLVEQGLCASGDEDG